MLQECTHQSIVLAGSFGKRYEIAALFLNFLRYEKTYMERSSMYHNTDCLHMTTGAHCILYKIERSLWLTAQKCHHPIILLIPLTENVHVNACVFKIRED